MNYCNFNCFVVCCFFFLYNSLALFNKNYNRSGFNFLVRILSFDIEFLIKTINPGSMKFK